MDLNEYQRLATRTNGATEGFWEKRQREVGGVDRHLVNALLGLAGEAGELCDLMKKHLGHGHPLDRDKLKGELGDVLWYVADLCSLFNLSLADVAEANIEKLRRRYPDGFSTDRSVNREAAA